MYFSEKVTLRTTTAGQDTGGYPSNTFSDKIVFADIKSTSRSEFYSANANKIDITLTLDVNSSDWNNADTILYNNKQYTVIRAYKKGLGKVELNCSDKG